MASAEPVTVQLAPDRPRSSREIYTVMSGLMIAMLLAMLDNMIVGTALPTIVGELGGLDHLSWVVTAYVLATTVSTPIWGKLGDLFGRKDDLHGLDRDLPRRLGAVRTVAGHEPADRASARCRASAPAA